MEELQHHYGKAVGLQREFMHTLSLDPPMTIGLAARQI
jgi:hypothetical protein